MRFLLATLFTALSAVPAAAQQRGVFIGVDDDPVLGSPDAKVLMIEFGDYQCPSCRMFWKDIEPRLKKDYIDTGKVKLVFRDFPLMQIIPKRCCRRWPSIARASRGSTGNTTTRSFASSTTRVTMSSG